MYICKQDCLREKRNIGGKGYSEINKWCTVCQRRISSAERCCYCCGVMLREKSHQHKNKKDYKYI